MKVKIVSELISVATIGTLIGLHEHRMHEKYHQLGREAWLSDKSHYFDKYLVNPSSAMYSIIVLSLYKILAIVIAKGLSTIAEKKAKEQC